MGEQGCGIVVVDFGSQTTQLIARRVRELNAYAEIMPCTKFVDVPSHAKGIILSGSSHSVYEQGAFTVPLHLIRGRVPLLGICYGAQLLAHQAGGVVAAAGMREYGQCTLSLQGDDPLMSEVPNKSAVWMSHGDAITKVPDGFTVVGSTDGVPLAAFRVEGELTWGVQFHPEVTHTSCGLTILENFVRLCGCIGTWTTEAFIERIVPAIRRQVGSEGVLMALSGGVDSTVAAVLISRAVGSALTCVTIDSGLMRKGETEEILDRYVRIGLNVVGVDAAAEFFDALRGVTEPEEKRKAIGATFIDVFEREARKIGRVAWLGQGTIYPDVIESLSITGQTIKKHHNVGGLPERMALKLVEPLRELFKDEVRRVGAALGLPPEVTGRHPFPGPGLGIRVLGEVTPDAVAIVREADHVFISALREAGLYDKVWQAGAVLLPVRSVGVMGDARTHDKVVALRAVQSVDGMTADWVRLPYEFLEQVSNEIVRRVAGVNRVVYDITSKPPGTIEWE